METLHIACSVGHSYDIDVGGLMPKIAATIGKRQEASNALHLLCHLLAALRLLPDERDGTANVHAKQ